MIEMVCFFIISKEWGPRPACGGVGKRSTDMEAGVNGRIVGIHVSRNVRTTWYRYRDLNPGFQDENLMS